MRNEIQAMNDQYQKVLEWEAQFAAEIEALKQEDAKKAQSIYAEFLLTVQKSKNSRGASWGKVQSKMERLEKELSALGYGLKENWYRSEEGKLKKEWLLINMNDLHC